MLAAFVTAAGSAAARDSVAPIRVNFAPGSTSKSITGSVRGYAVNAYLFRARAGQSISAALKTSNASNYFTVGAVDGELIFDGTMDGSRFQGKLPSTGDYQINVFLMRNAARRNETGRYTLTVGVK